MKKAAVYSFALLLGLALALLIPRAFVAWQDSRYLESASRFVDAAVLPLLRDWEAADLREHGSAELLRALPGNDLTLQVRGFSRVGPLQEVHAVEGRLEERGLFAGDSPPHAHFTLDASFANTRADVNLELLLQDGQWKIDSLRVPAPLLLE